MLDSEPKDDPPQPLKHTPVDGDTPQDWHGQEGQYRAALLGVYVATSLPVSTLQPPWPRPMSLRASIDAIKRLKGALGNRALRVATAQLCVGVVVRKKAHLRQSVTELVGKETAEAIWERIVTIQGTQKDYEPSAIQRTVYGVLRETQSPVREDPPESVTEDD